MTASFIHDVVVIDSYPLKLGSKAIEIGTTTLRFSTSKRLFANNIQLIKFDPVKTKGSPSAPSNLSLESVAEADYSCGANASTQERPNSIRTRSIGDTRQIYNLSRISQGP